MLHPGDRDLHAVISEAVAAFGNGGKLLVSPLAHQGVDKLLVLLRVVIAEPLHNVADGFVGVHDKAAVSEVNYRLLHDVVLVPDLAHKLLQNVLDRDNAERAAEIVRDDGHIELAS